jgi:hypothetical protein
MKFSTILLGSVLLSVAVAADTFGSNNKQNSNVNFSQDRRLETPKEEPTSLISILRALLNAIFSFLKGPDDEVVPESISSSPFNFQTSVPTIASSDAPSMIPSDVPSAIPSDFPSLAPSDVPSDLPSSVPSGAPTSKISDSPSTLPSDSPSTAPILARGGNEFVLPNESNGPPEGYEACASSEIINYDELTEITVLFGYRFTVRPGFRETLITRHIEQALQSVLIDQVCVDSTGSGAMAISPEPDDIPSAFCDEDVSNVSYGNSTCHSVAVRTNLLIPSESPAEMAEIYCKTIEVLREYIGSGDLIGIVDGVDTIEVFAGTEIIPEFCALVAEVVKENNQNVSSVKENIEQEVNDPIQINEPIGVGATVGIAGSAALLVALTVLYVYMGSKRGTRHDALQETASEAV